MRNSFKLLPRLTTFRFRWAQLQLESLRWIRFEKDIRAALGRLPRELSELYQELYERMISTDHETDRAVAINVLRWMLCAGRRLASNDFFVAISLNLDVPVDSIDEDVILDLLHNFVVSDDSEGIQTFRFSHLSVREFLEKRPEYSIAGSNAFAAEVCLLTLIGSCQSPTAEKFLRDRGRNSMDMGFLMTESYKNGIHDYSLRFWPLHSMMAGNNNRTVNGPLREIFQFFLFDDSDEDCPLNCWTRSRQRKKMESNGGELVRLLGIHRRSRIRSFFLGCAYGFSEVVSTIMKGSDIEDDLKEEGFVVAVQHFQYETLKVLLGSEYTLEIPEKLLLELVEDNSAPDALEWLLEWSKSIKITERIVSAANRLSSRTMTLLLDHAKDLVVTDDMLESASWTADAGAMRILLSRASKPKITTEALRRAARSGDSEMVQLLLGTGIDPGIITSDVLGQAARAGNIETMKILLERARDIEITDETMEEAARCRRSCETVQMLIDHGGKVTQDVTVAAAKEGGASVLELLLGRGGQVTEQILEAGARNCIDGTEVSKLLLHQANESLTQEDWVEIMKKAAENTWHGPGVVKLLLDAEPTYPIPEEILLAATQKNSISGNEILDNVLENGRDMEITADIVESSLRHLDYNEVLSKVLDRHVSTAVTTGMLIAAAENPRFGDEIMSLLVTRSAVLHTPTEEVVRAVVSNSHSGFEMLRILEHRFGQFTFSNAVMEAASAHGSPSVMELILDRQTTIPIKETLLLAAASSGVPEVMKLLLERSGAVVTEQMAISAAGNRGGDKDMIKLPLAHSKSIKINSAMIGRAAGCEWRAVETLRFLLNRTGRIKLSSDVFQGALESGYCCSDVVAFLLKANVEVEVTEDVFVAAGESPYAAALFRLFRDHGFQVKASQEIIDSAVTRGYADLLALLLDPESGCEVRINDQTLETAAKNGQENVLRLLSEHGFVDLEKTNWQNIARLHNAAIKGKADDIRKLIGLGVNPDLADEMGRTPLSWAVAPGVTEPCYWRVGSGQKEAIKELLSAQVNLESKSDNGRTPLCWAAFGNQRAAVKILLDAGASVHVTDYDGNTPASLAKREGHLRLAKALQG
jgi:Ankyrin repeats (3 copies)